MNTEKIRNFAYSNFAKYLGMIALGITIFFIPIKRHDEMVHVNWIEKNFKLDSITKGEIYNVIYHFREEYGKPDNITVSTVYKKDAELVYFNSQNGIQAARISFFKDDGQYVLGVEPAGLLTSTYGVRTMNDLVQSVLFDSYFSEGDSQ